MSRNGSAISDAGAEVLENDFCGLSTITFQIVSVNPLRNVIQFGVCDCDSNSMLSTMTCVKYIVNVISTVHRATCGVAAS